MEKFSTPKSSTLRLLTEKSKTHHYYRSIFNNAGSSTFHFLHSSSICGKISSHIHVDPVSDPNPVQKARHKWSWLPLDHRELGSGMHGRTFLYRVGSVPWLAISDPDMIKEVLTSGSIEKIPFNQSAKLFCGQ